MTRLASWVCCGCICLGRCLGFLLLGFWLLGWCGGFCGCFVVVVGLGGWCFGVGWCGCLLLFGG